MAATYEPIATTTLVSAASNITFSSIPATYTDLRLVLVAIGANAGTGDQGLMQYQYNGDTGSNYSLTEIEGNGTSALSWRETSTSLIYTGYVFKIDSPPTLHTIDIFNYAGSTYKTALTTASYDRNGAGSVKRSVSLWRSTSAITSIKVNPLGSNFASGTTATLYGILKA